MKAFSRFLRPSSLILVSALCAALVALASPSRAELWTGDDVHGRGAVIECTEVDGHFDGLCHGAYSACLSQVWGTWYPLEGFDFSALYNADGSVQRYDCYVDPDGFILPATFSIFRICNGAVSNIPCEAIETEDLGRKSCVEKAGNPITILNGNKYEEVVDFETEGRDALSFRRYYNSLDKTLNASFKVHWRSNFDRTVFVSSGGNDAFVRRHTGKTLNFTKSGSDWVIVAEHDDARVTLEESGTDYIVTLRDQSVETYDSAGKLTEIVAANGYTQTLTYTSGQLTGVTDSYDRTISFTYEAVGDRLATVTDPDGQVYKFGYGSGGQLTSVTYPDARVVTYHYDNTDYSYALTGITDESGTRISTWTYDLSGRATSSKHGSGADETTITYNINGTKTVTNALGKEAIYTTTSHASGPRVTSIAGQASTNCPAATGSFAYDTNGYTNQTTDREGNITTTVNNSRGLPTSVTEDDGGTEERETTYTWHGTYDKPTKIEQAGRLKVEFTYSSTTGEMLTRTETDLTAHTTPYSTNAQTRVWTYSYTYNGTHTDRLEKVEIDGPLSGTGDKTTYEYDSDGYLTKVTNALSQVTDIVTVDGMGRPTLIEDPNGVRTALEYDVRGRVVSQTADSTGNALKTLFFYNGAGLLTKLVSPRSGAIQFDYDDANRLVKVTNDGGETISYTLNDLGNITKEETNDTSGTLKRTLTRTFDELGRTMKLIGASAQETEFAYNKNDLITSVTDPRSNATSYAIDGLSRLKTITDALTNTVDLALDDTDNATSVTDQRSNATTYVYNGFGDVIRRVSPDSGTTDFWYDAAGNMTKMVDARSITTEYTYDNLYRRITKTFPGNTSENVDYSYDSTVSGNKGEGRLTKIEDVGGSTEFTYDALGRVTSELRTIGVQTYTTSYVYDDDDNLTQITYPSGRIVTYARDKDGQVTSVATKQGVSAAEVVIASNITYMPFGPIASLRFGNGQVSTYTYDQDYRLTDIVTGDGATTAQDLDYAFDSASNISSITDNQTASLNQTFGYDDVDRLTDADGVYGDIDYAYDAGGNRTSRTVDAGTPDSYTNASTSNRLTSVSDGVVTRNLTYSANGNLATDSRDSGLAFNYSHDNRLIEVTDQALTPNTIVSFTYNDLGQRVIRDVAGGSVTHFHFDRDGILIAESDSSGNVQREYIYLDSQPLAVIEGGQTVGTPSNVTMDNGDAGTAESATWDASTDETGYQGSDYEIRTSGDGTETYSWTPSLAASGSYQVFVKYPGSISRGGEATFTVHHEDGTADVVVDQREAADWKFLGNFSMAQSSGHKVVLSDNAEAIGSIGEVYIENGDIETIPAGTWVAATTALGESYLTASANSGNSYTWRAAVPESGRYTVWVRWQYTAGNATDAPFTVHHAGGTTTVDFDQQNNGGRWMAVGTFDFDQIGDHKIVLGDVANGTVSADAVRFVRDASTTAAQEIILDNTAATYTGTWPTSTSNPQRVGADYRYINRSNTGTATWTPTLPATDNYRVYISVPQGTSSVTDAPVTVYHDGGSTAFTLNQRLNGGEWIPLGSFAMTPGQNRRVVITNAASVCCWVVADAVKFVRDPTATAEIVIDNPATTKSGTWLVRTFAGGGMFWNADYERTDATGLSQTMTWTPTLPSAGRYRVFARWAQDPTYAPDAPFTIHHDGGLTTIDVDQTRNGGRWMALGDFDLTPASSHRVVLSDDAAGNVVGDAVKFVKIGDSRIVQADAVKFVANDAEDVVYVHADHLAAPHKMTDATGAVVWDAAFTPFGVEDSIVGTAANDNRFPGQYHEAAISLSYNWWRQYDPSIGRYIQSDPIGLAGGLNTYAYVDGNPVNAVDPEGLQKATGIFGGGATTSRPKGTSPSRYHGGKPRYSNPGYHDPRNPNIKRGKTPLPEDAEAVFKNCIPNTKALDSFKQPKAWYGQNSKGEWYRFNTNNRPGADYEAHFSGITEFKKLPQYVKERYACGIAGCSDFTK